MDNHQTSLLDMTVGIVANYVAQNSVKPEEVAGLLVSTYAALTNVGEPHREEPEVFQHATAAKVRKSISDQGLVSFLDGKTYQSLRRHLGANGLTPEEYRDRYGLPGNYPMVSPAYSAKRSELAKSLGLGQKGGRGRGAKPAPKSRAKGK